MVFFATRGLLGPSGTNAGDIDVGTEVILSENGQPVNYLVVNQGIPENSPLYDASCDGTWLLRKDIAENRQWHSSNSNDYRQSTINAYLNSDWLDRYDPAVAEAIVQAKIPYVNGMGLSGSVASGANGLSVKAFLLGVYEVGMSDAALPIDGAKLAYFDSTNSNSDKRVAYLNSIASSWWTRDPRTDRNSLSIVITNVGIWASKNPSSEFGLRPALILPYDFKFTSDQIAA